MKRPVLCLVAVAMALNLPLIALAPSFQSVHGAPVGQEDPGQGEYPQVIITETIDASGNGTSVAQVSFKNADTHSLTFDLWWWGASASQQSNLHAWDAQGPISVQTETIGYQLYIYILFRHSLPPGETYTYWLSTDILGLAWWNGNAWSRSFCLCAGWPVGEYRVKLVLPGEAAVQSASPAPSKQTPGHVEWVFYDIPYWECRCTSASYKLTCPAGRVPVVLVHGWHGPDNVEESQLRFMKDWLEADGCDVYYATGIGASLSLERNAERLRDYLRDQVKAQTVILVGHSRGGLVARAFVDSSLNTLDVDKMIMLGTPNAGVTLKYVDAGIGALLWMELLGIRDENDLLSMFELQPEYMCFFNLWHRNSNNTPYLLLGGDAGPIPVPANDGLVTVESAHSASGSQNVYLRPPDVHGWWREPGDFGRSYVYPRNTYDACLRPLLEGKGPEPECNLTYGASFSMAESSEQAVSTPYQSGLISAGETMTHSIHISATSSSEFHLVWDQGDLDLALLDPLGTTIDHAYAESSSNVDFISFEPDTIINYNMYTIADTIPGTWTLSVTASYTEPMDVAFSTFATLEPTLDLQASADKTLYGLNEPIVVTATLSYGLSGLAGATVEALIGRPDLVTETLTLYDDGAHEDGASDDGHYGNIYASTNEGGPYALFVTAEGLVYSVPFARADELVVQVSPETAQLAGNYSDSPEDADNNGRYEYLVVHVEVDVADAGDFLVSGILLGPAEEEIASTVHSVSLPLGTQTVPLRFDGDLIYASGLSGPYTLTQLFLMDGTGLPIKLDEAYDAWVTAAYDHTKFGLNNATYVPLVLRNY